MHTILFLAAEAATAEPAGGLFDLDATLPLVAIQTLVLVAILNVVFYKPFSKVIDDRDAYVRQNRLEAQERLDKTQKLAEQYEQDLADTRRQAQAIIAEAQAEAQRLASAELTAAQQEAQQQREQTQRELDAQRQAALQSLDQEVEGLSQQIMNKLLSV